MWPFPVFTQHGSIDLIRDTHRLVFVVPRTLSQRESILNQIRRLHRGSVLGGRLQQASSERDRFYSYLIEGRVGSRVVWDEQFKSVQSGNSALMVLELSQLFEFLPSKFFRPVIHSGLPGLMRLTRWRPRESL